MIQGARGWRGSTRFALAAIAAACALAAVVTAAAAADATETATFGEDGIASQSLGVHFDETGFSSVIAQADGGLVAQREDQLETYLADGAPDPAAPARPVSKYREAFPLASGKTLVLDEGKLTRLNPDGSVDTGFGGTGVIEVSSGAQAISELPSGKILMASVNSGGTHERLVWVRVELLNPDGSIDRGVGENGTLTLSLPSYEETSGGAKIAPTGDGGALVVGAGFLLELRADGSPNPGFGGDGLVTGLPHLAGARVLPDGSVEGVGWDSRDSGRSRDLAVVNYTAAGAPDSSFGPEGIRRFAFGGDGEVDLDVASWAGDGSVIVGGRSEASGPCPPAEGCAETPILAAFDPAGNLDSGFGQGGVLKLTSLAAAPATFWDAGVLALTRRPDGSIVAAGRTGPDRTGRLLSSPPSRRGARCSQASAKAESCACASPCPLLNSSSASPLLRTASCSPPALPILESKTSRSWSATPPTAASTPPSALAPAT